MTTGYVNLIGRMVPDLSLGPLDWAGAPKGTVKDLWPCVMTVAQRYTFSILHFLSVIDCVDRISTLQKLQR